MTPKSIILFILAIFFFIVVLAYCGTSYENISLFIRPMWSFQFFFSISLWQRKRAVEAFMVLFSTVVFQLSFMLTLIARKYKQQSQHGKICFVIARKFAYFMKLNRKYLFLWFILSSLKNKIRVFTPIIAAILRLYIFFREFSEVRF